MVPLDKLIYWVASSAIIRPLPAQEKNQMNWALTDQLRSQKHPVDVCCSQQFSQYGIHIDLPDD